MSISEKLKNLEERYAWSLFGFLLAVIFGGLSFYLGFIKEDKPNLNYLIQSNTRVFELREQLKSISLKYEDINILEDDKSLSIVIFKVINEGNESILKNFYAPSSPLGFKTLNGSLLNVELVNASNSYIKNNLVITFDSSYANFSPLIIDPKESFTIKSLILHPSDSIPDIQSIGKIAKQNKIDVVDLNNEVEDSFFLRVWQGSLFVHVTRFVLYFLSLIFSMVALFVIIVIPSLKITSKMRERRVKKFKERRSKNLDSLNNIFDYYVKRGSKNLLIYHDLVEKQYKLTKLVELQGLQKSIYSIKNELDFPRRSRSQEDFYTMITLEELENLGIINEENGSIKINEDLFSDFRHFIQYLQIIEN